MDCANITAGRDLRRLDIRANFYRWEMIEWEVGAAEFPKIEEEGSLPTDAKNDFERTPGLHGF